jgi:hypothetical protein
MIGAGAGGSASATVGVSFAHPAITVHSAAAAASLIPRITLSPRGSSRCEIPGQALNSD